MVNFLFFLHNIRLCSRLSVRLGHHSDPIEGSMIKLEICRTGT